MPVWSSLGSNPLRFLTSGWPWRSLAYLLSTAVVGAVALAVFLVTIAAGVVTSPIIIGLFILGGVPTLGMWLAVVERRRLRLMLVRIPTLVPDPDLARRRWWNPPRDATSWRGLGYAVLLALLLWIVDAIAAVMVVVLVGVTALSPLIAHFTPVSVGPRTLDSTTEALPYALLATPVLYVVGAYLVTGLAAAQASLAHILLSPREEELEKRVSELRRSRLQLVDAFETERKRIERDLHDGVQQRLVALTMALGRAEMDVPAGVGLDLVRRAHAEAEAALADLREVVRGVHPRVLTDFGLAAAIREVADRMPIAVHVDVAFDDRPEPQVEAAAYFVVSEGLANVAKHSSARSASVTARRRGDRLVLVVGDDGDGGAAIGVGSGLSGLVTRLDALGGTLVVSSPVGGPTELRMESPWQVEH